jgi:formylglycine-generating enzyme required for sulfatase activity
MQKSKSNRSSLKKTAGIVICLISLTFLLNTAAGQVVIVANKLRESRPSSKSKTKSKPKTTEIAAPAPTPEQSPDPLPKSLTFAVVPPTPTLVKDVETPSEAANTTTLLGYEFDVVTSDKQGKVAEMRKEQARYFAEALSGGIILEMTEIPGGMFLMGSTEEEIEQVKRGLGRGMEKEVKEQLIERLRWETPQHVVKLPTFYMSKFEVTQAQWRAVASLPKVKRELMSDPSYFKGGARPVEQVSWEDAVEFCERLSRATGRKYRLPTEAEWEYAARAGTPWPFHFGATVTAAWANYHGKYPFAAASKGANREQTVAVGSLGIANAFGLYDMHGNVWEWCLDSWHDSYFSSPADGRSWEEDGVSYLKVLRGGAWDSSAGESRVSSRNRITSSLRLNNAGFRIVAESPGNEKATDLSHVSN